MTRGSHLPRVYTATPVPLPTMTQRHMAAASWLPRGVTPVVSFSPREDSSGRYDAVYKRPHLNTATSPA